LTPAELADVAEMQAYRVEGSGYRVLQATKPQTVAFALSDSPAGLAAWIVEKFRGWSDCDGDVESSFTRDELLTNIMIYWVTNTAGSSARLYRETRHPGWTGRVEVPVACAIFPKEMSRYPRRWVEPHLNVTRWTTLPRGGHFAALEEPQLLVEDVRSFFGELRA
jgi:pimeloyl-ACP methyl ester carboxylesterase